MTTHYMIYIIYFSTFFGNNSVLAQIDIAFRQILIKHFVAT